MGVQCPGGGRTARHLYDGLVSRSSRRSAASCRQAVIPRSPSAAPRSSPPTEISWKFYDFLTHRALGTGTRDVSGSSRAAMQRAVAGLGSSHPSRSRVHLMDRRCVPSAAGHARGGRRMRRGRTVCGGLFVLAAGLLIAAPWGEGSWVGRPAPELTNQTWINSAPLRLADLRGKVVLLEFWTFG